VRTAGWHDDLATYVELFQDESDSRAYEQGAEARRNGMACGCGCGECAEARAS
jgi:hypothetical protein